VLILFQNILEINLKRWYYIVPWLIADVTCQRDLHYRFIKIYYIFQKKKIFEGHFIHFLHKLDGLYIFNFFFPFKFTKFISVGIEIYRFNFNVFRKKKCLVKNIIFLKTLKIKRLIDVGNFPAPFFEKLFLFLETFYTWK